MNRFNLTFKGEILPGKKPEQVKLRFGKMFAIDDPEQLERFFSGQTIILRRNLERKVAAEYFQKLRQLGVAAELVKVTAKEAAAAIARDHSPTPKPKPTPAPIPTPTPTDQSLKPAPRGMDHDILERKPGQVDQSWAVSSSRANRAPANKEAPTTAATAHSNAAAEAERETQKDQAIEEARKQQAEQIQREAKEAARQKALQEEAARKATEEAARRETALAEKKRLEAAEAASQKALQEKAARKAAEEAARRKAELAEKMRLEAAEAASQKALQEKAARKAAEEAARRKAELAEKLRLVAAEAASQKALQEEAERKAAEEAARKKAEELARQQAIKEEARRKAAEEAAQRKAEEQRKREEAQRKKVAEAARQKALQEEAKRKAAEETARRKAELAKKKRIEAQEAARLKTELAEKKRKAIAEEARKQAILKEEKRKAAAKAATLKAEQEEQARKAAAEIARLKAEQRRLEQENAAALAAEKSRQQQERALEQQRIAAADAAEQQALEELQKRKAAAREARERAQKAEEKRQLAAQAVQRKVEERQQKDQQQAQLQAMEEQAIRRGAAELSQRASLKPVKARVKTNLEVGQRRSRQEQGSDLPRRRQKGEPNLYSLRPFRNTAEVRARAEQAHQRMRTGFTVAAIALAGLLLLGGRLMNIPPTQAITGAGAVVIDPQSRPLLLAGDSLLLHDRSGVGSDTVTTDSLGLDTLQAPMAFNAAGELLTMGRLKLNQNPATSNESLHLLRCNIEKLSCQLFSDELADSSVAGFAIHPLDGAVFVADTATGELLKASAEGVILARATAAIPDKPVLRLESGLLFMNSALGPAVSVLRYDDSAFGQQLDEILLLPPAAVAAGQTRVSDFVLTADNWWASLYSPETGSTGLYRFDTQWNFVGAVALMADTQPQQLVSWGEKTLVRDEQHIPIQRFNAQGKPEVALVSNLLESLVTQRQRSATLTHAAWRIALIASAVIFVVGLCLGNLQRLRGLVYKAHRERGADPIDDYAEEVLWVDPAQDRPTQLRRTGISYTILSIALILLAMGQTVAVIPLVALLIALSGPAIGLVLLSRSHTGHIGILAEQVILVDHSGMYHLGAGPRIQHRGPFLLIDDVVVFSGSKNLPAFSSKQVQASVTPLAQAGIKVDRTTVLVKLLQSQHPLAQGALATLATLAAALALLALQGIF